MRFTAVKMRLQGRQAINLKYSRGLSVYTICGVPWAATGLKAGSVEFCANILLDGGEWSESLECARTPPHDRFSVGAGAHQTGHSCIPDSRFVIKTIVDYFVSVSSKLELSSLIPLDVRYGRGHEVGGGV